MPRKEPKSKAPKRSRLYREKRQRNETSLLSEQQALESLDLVKRGIQLFQRGSFQDARGCLIQAIQKNPQSVDGWHTLGMTLLQLQFADDALECVEKANALAPFRVDIVTNLAIIHRARQQRQQALETIDHAIQLDASYPQAGNIRGILLMELERLDEAEEQLRCVLTDAPEFLDAAMNLGNVLLKKNCAVDAVALLQTQLEHNPYHKLLTYNLCEALRELGQWHPASERLQSLILQHPNFWEARICLGRVLTALGRFDEAIEWLRPLIDVPSARCQASRFLGKIYLDLSEYQAAEHHLLEAANLDQDNPYVNCALGQLYADTGQLTESETYLRRALTHAPDLHAANSGLLFVLSGQTSCSAQTLYDAHRQWGSRFQPSAQPLRHRARRTNSRKLRIGYVSPDLRKHAVAAYLLPVLESHNRDQFEIACFAEIAKEDEVSRRIQKHVDSWMLSRGLSDQQLADRINEQQIDILVDLAGHTRGNRLPVFVHRPAPIQVTWLGYPNTTGLDCIDYRLTCNIQDPEGHSSYHTESLVRLPFGSFCYAGPDSNTEVNERPAIGNRNITFGSLHRPFKINDGVLDCWSRVLEQVKNSRLILLNTNFSEDRANQMLRFFESRGIAASRIDIRSCFQGDTHLTTYHEIDIALDVFPWAGGTTTLEALWMGVPVVALSGDRRAARSTAAIVHHVGHPELLAKSIPEYVQLAANLASDVRRLEQYRRRLRNDVRETVANPQRFTKSLEDCFRTMWENWQSQQENSAA